MKPIYVHLDEDLYAELTKIKDGFVNDLLSKTTLVGRRLSMKDVIHHLLWAGVRTHNENPGGGVIALQNDE